MDYKTTAVHSTEFSAAHQTINADPADPESQPHGHRYILTVSSTDLETTWFAIDEWVLRYLHMRDLAGVFNFPTTPARIASYLMTVFAQIDPQIDRLRLQVDGGDTIIIDAVDTSLIASRVHEIDEARSKLH